MVMNRIDTILRSKSIKNIKTNSNVLIFKSSLFDIKSNWNIFISVEEGSFTLDTYENYSILIYDFSLFRLYILTASISILIGLLTTNLYSLIICILFLGVVNFILTIYRHKKMFHEIVRDIRDIE